MSDSNSTYVDTNTDNLDDFNALFHGHAKEVETTNEPASSEEEVVEDDASESEDVDTLEPTNEDDDDSESEDGDTDDEDADETDPEPEPDPKPKKSRVQERIDELTREKHEERRQRLALEAKLDEILAQVKPKEAEPTSVQTGPTPDDSNEDGTDKYPLGEFDPAYIRDLTRHTIEQERKVAEEVAEERARVEREEQAQVQLATEWTGKLEAAKERYPDLMEKNGALVESFSDLDPAYGEYLASTIMSMDNGPDVLYHLASNPEEARAIVNSGAAKATISLGRLSARFETTTETKPKLKVSSAPVPPPRVNKGAASVSTVAPDTDDLDSFEVEFFKKKGK